VSWIDFLPDARKVAHHDYFTNSSDISKYIGAIIQSNNVTMETPQEYIARILHNIEGEEPLKILASTPKKIGKLIKKVKKKTLYLKPAPHKWSVAEIIAHLAETEIVMGWRYRSVAEKNEVKIQSFDQNKWAKNSDYEKSDVDEMLEMYRVVRRANLAFLKNLPKEKFEQYGMHEERGKETIAHIIRMEAGHDLNHLRQIEAILPTTLKKGT
jgi:hypothetical protein